MADEPEQRVEQADAAGQTFAAAKRRGRKEFFFGDVARTTATLGGCAVLIALISLAAFLSSQSGGSSPAVIGSSAQGWTPPPAPDAISSESDLEQYVLSRLFWRTRPSVFKESLGLALDDHADNGGPRFAEVDEGGDVRAYSIAELTAEGASLAGRIVYVVGRLVSRNESPTSGADWTTSSLTDIALGGPHGPTRVYGLLGEGPPITHTGEAVFFRAVVTAVAQEAANQSVIYVVGLEEANAAWRASSPNIRRLLAQFGRSGG